LEFPLPEAAENLILKATKLRNTWDNLLKLKLEGIDNYFHIFIIQTVGIQLQTGLIFLMRFRKE